MSVTARPIHPHFGAEVDGVDLTRPVDDAAFAAIESALDRYSLLVLRDQPIDDAAQLDFARRFGRLEKTRKGGVGEGSELVILTNLDADGNVVEARHKQHFDARANQQWHSDSSFRPVPAYASILSGRRVATRGGETEFASTRVGYATLDPATRERIEGLRAVHHFAHSRARVEPGRLAQDESDFLPPVSHPLVRHHSRTGARALFVGSHVREVIGLDREEGVALAEALVEHVTRPDLVHVHRWRRHDLIIWDNSAVLHRGRPWERSEPRHMVRATVADDAYTAGTLAAA